MKITNLRFYTIKVFILLLINAFVFALSFIILKILGTLSVSGLDEISNSYLRCIITATVSQIVYLAYIYNTEKNIRDRSKPVMEFVRCETTAYGIMMLIPTVNAFIVGYEALPSSLLGLFFLPNELFYFATRNPVLGFILALIIYAATVWAAYRINLKKHPETVDDIINDKNSGADTNDASLPGAESK